MKVVHLINDLERAGAQTALTRLVATMDQSAVHSRVISLTDLGPLAAELTAAGIGVDAVGLRRGSRNPFFALRLVRLLRRHRPDILQTWLYHSDLFGTIAGKLTGIRRVVWTIRCAETDARYHTGVYGAQVRMLGRLSRLPAAIVTNSAAGQRTHTSLGYRPRHWEIIPNGFDPETFRPDPAAGARLRAELDLPATAVIVAIVGRTDPLKDHVGFIRAAAATRDTPVQAQFVMVGSGLDWDNAALTGEIDALGLRDRFHLLGERSDMAGLTAGFDIAVSSSIGEGMPNAIGEAMACAVPCVVTDVGDSATLVGDCGEVVPPSDPGALARAITALAAMDVTQRREIGDRARARIEDNFSLAQVAARYQRFYQDLAAP